MPNGFDLIPEEREAAGVGAQTYQLSESHSADKWYRQILNVFASRRQLAVEMLFLSRSRRVLRIELSPAVMD